MVKQPSARKSFWRRNDFRLASIAGVVVLAAWGAMLVRQNSPPADTAPAGADVITVYKRPGCQCCDLWARHLRKAGFKVEVEPRTDLDEIRARRARLGVPASYSACHTAVVRGYVIEGHVPATDIQRLLIEKPVARGLAVPGMPIGSPGMEGRNSQPYEVFLLNQEGPGNLFARHDAR